MNETDRRQELGRRVRADRLRIHRTVDAARMAVTGKPVSRGAWDGVEQGKPAKAFTLAAIEESLGWPQGQAERILAGDTGHSEAAGIDDVIDELESRGYGQATRDHIRSILESDEAARQAGAQAPPTSKPQPQRASSERGRP